MGIDRRDFDVVHIGENLISLLLKEEDVKKSFLQHFFPDSKKETENFEVSSNRKIKVCKNGDEYNVDPEANLDILFRYARKYYAVELKLGRSITGSSFNETTGFLKKACAVNSKNKQLLDGGMCSILRDHGLEKLTICVDSNKIEREWCLVVRNERIKGRLMNSSAFNQLFKDSKVRIISLEDIFTSTETQNLFNEKVKELLDGKPSFWERWVPFPK